MLKYKIITSFSFGLVLTLACAGCRVPEPEFLTNVPHDNNQYSKAKQMKYEWLSEDSAHMGWWRLSNYHKRANFIPGFEKSDLKYAMQNFNYCWSFNSENYQAYWGAGVIRGEQATLTDDPEFIEKYLKQSIEFMHIAFKHNVPAKQVNNLNMDLANSYNGLGAFYLQMSKPELTKTNLESARKLLLDVTQKEPENGRALYLLAVTAFYQGNFAEAKRLAEQSLSKHYKVPEDFLKDLAEKSSGVGKHQLEGKEND